jgi:hypothetical protein
VGVEAPHSPASPRDALIGDLLAVDRGIRLLDEASAGDGDVELMAQAVEDLIGFWQDELEDGGDSFGFAYGLPEWLVSEDGPLQALIGRLRDTGPAASPLWSRLLERIWEDDDGSLRERETDELVLLREALAESGAKEPPERFRSGVFAGVPASLTAATAAAGEPLSIVDLSGTAESLIAASGAEQRDLGWRRIRIDVPVIHAYGSEGVLIGLEAWFPDFERPARTLAQPRSTPLPPAGNADEALAGDSSTTCMDRSFVKGVEDGHHAAWNLLRRLGDEQAARRIERMIFRLVGVRRPATVTDHSAGLPVALHVLAVAAGLPRPRCVATGEIDSDSLQLTRVQKREEVAPKLAAVRRDGVAGQLAFHTKASRLSKEEGVVAFSRPSLETAAAEVWGASWERWQRGLVTQQLAGDGLDCGWSHELPGAPLVELEGEEIWVPFAEENAAPELLEAIREGGEEGRRVKAVLSGWPGSGKTTMARWIGEQLSSADDRDWQVCWISPSPESVGAALENGAQRLIDAVGLLLRGTAGPRRLVILENLEATEESTDLSQLVSEIEEEQHVHVLALARFNRSAGFSWHTDGILVRSALYGPQLDGFAERLVDRYEKLRPARSLIPLARKAAGSSLDFLIRFLIEFGTELEVEDEATLRRIIAERAQAYSQPAEVEAIERLAAMSCLRLSTDPDDLTALSQEALDGLWARRRPIGSGRYGWYIPSYYLSRELVVREPAGHTNERFKARLVRILERLVLEAVGRDDRRVTILLTGARRYSDVIFRQILEATMEELLEWTKRASARGVAFFLARCGRLLATEDRVLVAERLVRKVSTGIEAFGVAELAICLKQIRRHDYLVGRPDSAGDPLADLERRVRRGVPEVLTADGAAGAGARLALMRQIDHMGFEHGDEILLENYRQLLVGLRPTKALHYRVAGEVASFLSRIANEFELHFDEGRLERVIPIDPESRRRRGREAPEVARGGAQTLLSWVQGVPELLETPGEGLDAGVYIGWLGLVAALEFEDAKDWEPLIAKVEEPLLSSLATAGAVEVARALNGLADRRRVMAIFLLGNKELNEPLRACLSNASPSESAILLGTLRNIRPRTAWSVLRRERGDGGLCEAMATKIHRWNDPRGAGQLLTNAAAVDETYGSSVNGFAHELAERTGPEFARRALEDDPRTSVIHYLLSGLAAAAAPYMDDLLEPAASRIAENIEFDSRAWPPKLALRLASDEALGVEPAAAEEFLARLGRALRVADGAQSVLFHRMTEADEPQALAEFHDLSAALDYPGRALAAEFAEEFDAEADWVRGALGRDASNTAQACRAIVDTLRRGGMDRPSKAIMSALEQRGWVWSDQLSYLRGERLAGVLQVLAKVDRTTAEKTVRQLDQPSGRRGRRSSRRGKGTLADRVWAAPAGASLSLLSTIEELRPSRGKELLSEFSAGAPRRWSGRLRDLRFVTDPQEWSLNYLRLAALDFFPSAEDRAHLWDRWSKGFGHIRSPRAAGALIRAYATWPDGLHAAREAAELLELQAISDRVAEGALNDLESVHGLIGTLAAIGMRGEARKVAAGLPDVEVAGRLTPRACGRLLDVLQEVDPSAATNLAAAAGPVIDQAVERRLVVKPPTHWLDVGWLAYQMAALGQAHRVTLGERPGTLPMEHPAALLWGTAWLDGDEWLREASQRAIDALATGPIVHAANHLCLCLVAASRHGQAGPVAAGRRSWAAALHAGPASLAILAECAAGDDAVLAALRQHPKHIAAAAERMARPENRARFPCAKAREALAALA